MYDEPSCRLVGRRSGRTFALGDAVKVEVQSVSVARRKVDFVLHGHRARHHDAGRGRDGDRRERGRGKHQRRPTERAQPERQRGRQDKRRGKIPSAGAGGGKSRPAGNRARGKPKKKR